MSYPRLLQCHVLSFTVKCENVVHQQSDPWTCRQLQPMKATAKQRPTLKTPPLLMNLQRHIGIRPPWLTMSSNHRQVIRKIQLQRNCWQIFPSSDVYSVWILTYFAEPFYVSGKSKPPEVGDTVFVLSLGKKGTVLQVDPIKEELLVQAGNMKLKLKLSDIETWPALILYDIIKAYVTSTGVSIPFHISLRWRVISYSIS